VSDELLGLDIDRVTQWLAHHVPSLTPPLHATRFVGGHSNITYRIADAAGRVVVLRRPPVSHTLSSAHDVLREYRIMSALADTPVPVPRMLASCTDTGVIGGPFFAMEAVAGHVIRDIDTASTVLSPAARRRAGESLVDALAALHGVDIDAVGLGDLAKRENYIARQLKRWHGQITEQRTRDLPLLDDVHARLAARIPEQRGATIVHGDYRVDNCILRDDGTVAAVLDWELCTLGDPLADVGIMLAYYTGPDDAPSPWQSQPSRTPGFPARHELAERYGERSGRDVAHIDYYVAFAYWKVACIIEGVYARYVGGALGSRSDDDIAPFVTQVDAALRAADETLARLH
jgi:aminoglycoside phosphotransferase (APT) family kinase protein